MIRANENGVVDMQALEISDIIDVSLLQNFQDNFAVGMNCASVTVDRNGEPVTKPSSYTRFCDQYVHKSHIGDSRCAVSHNRMGTEAARMKRPFIGKCHAGLIDFAAPVIIEGELLGTVLGGQILSSKPEDSFYKNIAREIQVDEKGFVDAVKRVDIVDTRHIQAAADVLFVVVNSLAQNGYNRIKLELLSEKLADNFLSISSVLQELYSSSTDITQQQQTLNTEIQQISSVANEINQVLSAIGKIADQTKILGINASIEAARAGEIGKSFAVVAQEIKRLSDNSKETAEVIVKLTDRIHKSVNSTIKNSEITLKTTKEQSDSMEKAAASIQRSAVLAGDLKNLTSSN